MDPRDIYKSDPALLAQLLAPQGPPERSWSDEDLKAMLAHQLSAAVAFDLGTIDPSLAGKLRTLSASQGLLLRSFNDLFYHENPPVELLRMTKEFAKACRHHPDSPLPREIALLLYFASIAAALVRCRVKISQLDRKSLVRGWKWFMEQSWVQKPLKDLLRQAMGATQAESGDSS